MDKAKRRVFGFAFRPGKRMFQISMSLKDNPGALADVLQILRNRVDWVGTVGYSKGEGKAIWSGFAQALRPDETPNSLRSLLASTGMVEDSSITSTEDGFLVDSFHTGVEDESGEDYMLVPMKGMSETYERLIEILGSGGESILYDEGVSAGKVSAQYFIEKLGIGFVREKMNKILQLFGSMGWGNAEMQEAGYGAEFTIRIADCFECAAGRRSRQYCSFQRGHLVGLISTIYDTPLECSEIRCRFRRDPFCEFKLVQKQGPRMEA